MEKLYIKFKNSSAQDQAIKYIINVFNLEKSSVKTIEKDTICLEFKKNDFFKEPLLQTIKEEDFFNLSSFSIEPLSKEDIKNMKARLIDMNFLNQNFKNLFTEQLISKGYEIHQIKKVEQSLKNIEDLDIKNKFFYTYRSRSHDSMTMIPSYLAAQEHQINQKYVLMLGLPHIIQFAKLFADYSNKVSFLIAHSMVYNAFCIFQFKKPIIFQPGSSFKNIFRPDFIISTNLAKEDTQVLNSKEADKCITKYPHYFLCKLFEFTNTFADYFLSPWSYRNKDNHLDNDKFIKTSVTIKQIIYDFESLCDLENLPGKKLFPSFLLLDKIFNLCLLMNEKYKENKKGYQFIFSDDLKKYIENLFSKSFQDKPQFSYDLKKFTKKSYNIFETNFFKQGADTSLKDKGLKLGSLRNLIHGSNLTNNQFETLFLEDNTEIYLEWLDIAYIITLAFFINPKDFIKTYSEFKPTL